MDTAPETHAPAVLSGIDCPYCGYATGIVRAERCPECGRALGRAAEVFIRHRRRLVSRSAVVRDRLVLAQVLVLMFSVLISMVASEGGVLIAVMVSGGLTIGLGIAMGSLSTMWLGRHEALFAYKAWRRREHWLHLPWLVGPACGIVVGLTMREPGRDSPEMVIGLLALPWLGGAIVVYIRWLRHVCGDAARYKIGATGQRLVTAGAGLVLLAVTAFLGAVMAVLGAAVCLRS